MCVCKTDALFGEPVDVGGACFGLRIVDSYIAVTQIVGEDVNDVWKFFDGFRLFGAVALTEGHDRSREDQQQVSVWSLHLANLMEL